MRKHHSAAHARARAARTCLGIITGSLILIGLTACGGGGDTASNSTLQPQGFGNDSAQAQAISTPALGTVTKDSGWSTVVPELPTRTFVQPSSIGTIYYIDSKRAFDPSSTPLATEDGSSPTKAFPNIGEFNRQVGMANLHANDAILLKCGSVFRNEMLFLNGISNIYIGPYQAGQTGPADCSDSQLPTLRQSKWGGTLTWTATDASNTVYSAPTDPSLNIERMFRYTVPLVKARYPNMGSTPKYLLATSASSNTQFKVSAAEKQLFDTNAGGQDIVGADVFIRSTAWLIERRTVSAYDIATGTVTLNRQVSDTIPTGAGYYLAGKAWMFDQPGEWYQSKTENKVYFRRVSTSDNPVDLEYTDATTGQGLFMMNSQNITISRIAFEHHEFASIGIESSNNITVSGADVRFASELGISVGKNGLAGAPSQNITIEFCKVRGVRGYGIKAGGVVGTNRLPISKNVTLRHNLVTETGMHDAAIKADGIEIKAMTAIRLGGPVPLETETSPPTQGVPDAQALGNIIINSGGPAIFLDNGRHGAIIDSNTVINACLQISDCGGIYTNNRDTTKSLPSAEGTTSATISNNIIVGVKGDTEGVATAALAVRMVREQTFGIYLDDLSANVEVANNQVTHAGAGIYLHNASWNKVHHNKIKAITLASIKVHSDWVYPSNTFTETIRGNVVHDNELLSHRAVDGNVFATNSSLSNGIQGNAPQVYAQLWLHATLNPSVFFTGDHNNESRNNTVVTHSKTTSPSTWRMNSQWVTNNNSPQTTQSSGGIWLLKTTGGYNKEVALPEWLKVTQSSTSTADVESSSVSYRPYALTLGNGGNSLIDPIASGSGWTWNAASQVSYATGASTCGEASVCASLTASQPWHTLMSNPFTTTQGQLYFVKYTLKQGAVKGIHNTTVRLTNSTMVGEYLQNVETNPDEVRYYEHFFRGNANSGANTVLALKPSDGVANSTNPYTTQYFSDATVHQVDAVAVLPGLDQLGVTAVNASAASRNFNCVEDLGIASANCSSVRDENNQPVTFPVSVGARTMKRFYINSSTWSN